MINTTQAKQLDQALLLASNVDVGVDASLTYIFTKGTMTPVNTSTWHTQDSTYRLLADCHSYEVALMVYFVSPVFTTTNSKVEVLVRQKRFTTDTTTTAPIIGAATLCADSITTISQAGLQVPLSFVPYAAGQASHGLFVTIDTTTTTLTTANIWLTGADYVTNQ